ncbi:hypothetical protein [Amycolatopsis sp. NPDC051102]|uniref:hypothetical protein n=1 Tax=Amycolatopsis sp. NPDC051102 TaxID=3155163 RepID=UPI003448C9CE
MAAKDALRREANLRFLDPVFVSVVLLRWCRGRWLNGQLVAHPQVGADHVDDRGALVLLRFAEAFQRVSAAVRS